MPTDTCQCCERNEQARQDHALLREVARAIMVIANDPTTPDLLQDRLRDQVDLVLISREISYPNDARNGCADA